MSFRTSLLRCLCFLLLSSSLLHAQRIWVVDFFNRPGTDFTDLPSAIASAGVKDGDIVFMRNAKYKKAATISKAIRLVGEGKVQIELDGTLLGPIPKALVITRIPAGKSFSMHGIWIYVTDRARKPNAVLEIRDNSGQVHLDTVRAGRAGFGQTSYSIDISNSNVTLRNVVSENTLRARGSRVVIDGGKYRGKLTPGKPPIWMQPHPGIEAWSSIVRMAGAHCFAQVNKYYGPSSALFASASGIEVREQSSFGSMSTVIWLQSDLRFPSVLSHEAKLAMPNSRYSGFLKVFSRRIPSLRSGPATLGGNVSASLSAQAGNLFVLLVGASGPPTNFPPFGILWLDLGTTVLLHGGVLGSSGRFDVKLQIPNEIKLGGFPLAFQALVGPFPVMEFSNVIVPVIR